jgi:hypothetical protein
VGTLFLKTDKPMFVLGVKDKFHAHIKQQVKLYFYVF